MSRPWMYRGRRVEVVSTADIPAEYRPGHRRDWIVQEVLSCMTPWSGGLDPIETVTGLGVSMSEIVVPQRRGEVIWARHKAHRARQVGLSPFVKVTRSFTRTFTVELTGTPRQPRLVRAYPGEYIPPLPWQNSARRADGGWQACAAFWRKHGYLFGKTLIVPGSVSETPPDWFA